MDDAFAAFESADACDLADRLMTGLEAGAGDGQGDSRCTGSGIPSDAAFLRVQDADGNDIVSLSVTDTAPTDPLVLLRGEYETWREDHDCPEPAEDTESADSDTAGSDTRADETPAESSGCGCATSGPTLGWLVLVGLLGLRRR